MRSHLDYFAFPRDGRVEPCEPLLTGDAVPDLEHAARAAVPDDVQKSSQLPWTIARGAFGPSRVTHFS